MSALSGTRITPSPRAETFIPNAEAHDALTLSSNNPDQPYVSTMMRNILFLRAPTSPTDRYENAFNSSGYHAVSVNPLETVLTNLDRLKEVVRARPGDQSYTGVIITSARACEAWENTVQELSTAGVTGGGDGWPTIPFYVVGETTASRLANIEKVYGRTPFTPVDIRGASTGTGEHLAQFILQDLGNGPGKFLYLTGDKNRDTLPTILRKGGWELDPLQVYATQGSSQFEQLLSDALHVSPGTPEPSLVNNTIQNSRTAAANEWWIVHFAPSSSAFATPILQKHFTLATLSSTKEGHTDISIPTRPQALIAAIGPTTHTYLRDTLHLHVSAIAAKPTPDDLLAAILTHDRAKETQPDTSQTHQ